MREQGAHILISGTESGKTVSSVFCGGYDIVTDVRSIVLS